MHLLNLNADTSTAPLSPPWNIVLAYELRMRKRVSERIREEGVTLVDAVQGVVKDAELRELHFITPFIHWTHSPAARSTFPALPPGPSGPRDLSRSTKRQRTSGGRPTPQAPPAAVRDVVLLRPSSALRRPFQPVVAAPVSLGCRDLLHSALVSWRLCQVRAARHCSFLDSVLELLTDDPELSGPVALGPGIRALVSGQNSSPLFLPGQCAGAAHRRPTSLPSHPDVTFETVFLDSFMLDGDKSELTFSKFLALPPGPSGPRDLSRPTKCQRTSGGRPTPQAPPAAVRDVILLRPSSALRRPFQPVVAAPVSLGCRDLLHSALVSWRLCQVRAARHCSFLDSVLELLTDDPELSGPVALGPGIRALVSGQNSSPLFLPGQCAGAAHRRPTSLPSHPDVTFETVFLDSFMLDGDKSELTFSKFLALPPGPSGPRDLSRPTKCQRTSGGRPTPQAPPAAVARPSTKATAAPQQSTGNGRKKVQALPDGKTICFKFGRGQCQGGCGRVHKCQWEGCHCDIPTGEKGHKPL